MLLPKRNRNRAWSGTYAVFNDDSALPPIPPGG